MRTAIRRVAAPYERFGLEKGQSQAAKRYQEEYLRPAPAGFASIRVHDLKHTFAGGGGPPRVTDEDRKVLLGHQNGSVTSHYSAAELGQLIGEANNISATDSLGRR